MGRDEPVNVQVMPLTTDPRRFYALSRIALVPSLCPENQPLVAVEAMINGIPVIGSDRGGIPEALGKCGFVLPLPERLTPGGLVVPEAVEVEPWVEAIVRLWDDQALYEEHSARARREALRWHPDRVRPMYAEFFGDVRFRELRTGMEKASFPIHGSGECGAGRPGPAYPSGPLGTRSAPGPASRKRERTKPRNGDETTGRERGDGRHPH